MAVPVIYEEKYWSLPDEAKWRGISPKNLAYRVKLGAVVPDLVVEGEERKRYLFLRKGDKNGRLAY